MSRKETNEKIEQITFVVGVAIRGPIVSGSYQVGKITVSVSYPSTIDLGFPTPIQLPKGLSTVFEVTWADTSGATARKLRSKGAERHRPIYYALEKINELLLAYKLVRVGHADGMGIRTIGRGDTLFYFGLIDGQSAENFNMGLKTYQRDYQWAHSRSGHPDDPLGTTEVAKPHIAANTYPIARRYVRCFELLEHGFYTEALVVAFSVLDDLGQTMLDNLLEEKDMGSETARNELLRGIKEHRLRLFLDPLLKVRLFPGSLLKVLSGKAIDGMWGDAETALKWLNEKRNAVAHGGYQAEYSTAAKAVYACIKTLVVLNQNGLIRAEFPTEMFRHAKITAAWTEAPPKWVPKGQDAEAFSLD